MRRRSRRSHEAHDLEVTPFINLMVVLVTFFLGSAAFFQSSVLELNIPPAVAGSGNPSATLQLEVIVRKDAIEVGDRNGGLIDRLPNKNGSYDFKGLNEVMKQLKAKFPDKNDATVLAEPDISYQVLVNAMDATRTFAVVSAGSVRYGDLFANVALGDAPARSGQ